MNALSKDPQAVLWYHYKFLHSQILGCQAVPIDKNVKSPYPSARNRMCSFFSLLHYSSFNSPSNSVAPAKIHFWQTLLNKFQSKLRKNQYSQIYHMNYRQLQRYAIQATSAKLNTGNVSQINYRQLQTNLFQATSATETNVHFFPSNHHLPNGSWHGVNSSERMARLRIDKVQKLSMSQTGCYRYRSHLSGTPSIPKHVNSSCTLHYKRWEVLS